MNLTTSLVDIEFISSSQNRSSFSESKLEELAQLILQIGGIIKPLVVKKIGLENYEVIDGHFEYYAAVKAQEINDNFEMIRAFIVSDEQVQLVSKQLQLLYSLPSKTNKFSENSFSWEIRFNNLESRLNDWIYNFQQEQKENKIQLQVKLDSIQQKMPEKLEPLDAFNKLNLQQLALALTTTGISSKEAGIIAQNIVKERKKQSFSSLANLVERVKKPRGKKMVKAITHEKMLSIVDVWKRVSFTW
jgi:hypothetical protein